MKHYYILRRDISYKTIGLKNAGAQSSFCKEKMNHDSFYIDYMKYFHGENSSLNLYNTPTFRGELKYLKINKEAKITDFLTFMPFNSGAEFLLNQKTYNMFLKYDLGNHSFFKTNVYIDSEQYLDYYMLYIQMLDMDIINFDKSIFYTGNSIRGKNKIIFKSFTDYKNDSSYKNVEKISIFKEKFNQDLDVFTIPFSSSIFISKSIKNEIEKMELKGSIIYDNFNDHISIE